MHDSFSLPSLRIIYRPTAAWQAVREARPRWAASLLIQVVPFALLCAVAWPGVRTIVLLLAAVMILALALFVLAPLVRSGAIMGPGNGGGVLLSGIGGMLLGGLCSAAGLI